ncbi:MAG: leucine-rich repeat protein, partial [Bacteroidaceae bacterium]|nr:leucine-rich repeat protein [Bacteroidaceae bacterium]
GCSQLKSLTFLSTTPATLVDNAFSGLPDDYVFYVPEEAVKTYKTKWPAHADHIQAISTKHTGIYEVTLTEPGTLAEKLGLTITSTDPLTISGNYSKYDSLKVVGPINGTDVGVIRFMGGRDVNNADVTLAGNLKYLDLYDAHIKAGGADYNQDGSNDRITEDNCIDTYMFWELDKLETLILPKSATKIMENAFNDCDELTRLVIGDNIQSIDEEVTHDSPKLQEVIMLCNQVPATDGDAWSEEMPIKTLYTTNAIRAHLSGSHVYYTRIDSITSAFEDDAVLHALAEKRIYTTDDLGKLKSFENVIKGNTQVESFNELVFAVEVKALGDNSLSGCTKLKEVMLPYAVETISAGAFRGCSSLTTLYVGCDKVPTLAPDALEDLPEDFVIYVDNGKEDEYREAWPQYADHIQGFKQLRDEVKVVTVTDPGTLAEALGFTVEMDNPSDVGRIGGDITSIKALKVIGPINGKDIAVLRMLGGREEEDGDEVILARMSYLDLYEATICTDENNICFNRDGKNNYVENGNEIPKYMFWQLDKLQTVILPKSVTKIDDNAFYDNIGIETIVVGDATVAVGNDAFGKCKKLKNIVFLCNEKAVLDGDAFTDPVSDQPYQVEKMYIPLSMYAQYVADQEYTTHTKEFCTNYEDDALFRAYGSHAVMNDDQLKNVTSVDGWFDIHSSVKDLSSLGKSSVETLKAATIAPLTELQTITFPATLKAVEESVFAANAKLQWADFSQCTEADVLTESNIGKLDFNKHALIYAPESFTATGHTNVVYGTEGNLKCDHFTISDRAAYAVPRAFTARAISYDRQFVQGETTTLCLPFDMEVPVGANAYLLDKEMKNAIVVSKVDRIEAYKPYVIITTKNMTLSTQMETAVAVAPNSMSQVTSANYVMTGTLNGLSAEEVERQRIYLLGDNNYWYLESQQALLPYRAYLQGSTPNLPNMVYMVAGDKDDILIITDDGYTQFENLEERVVGTLAYTRTLNNTWNALYVPFQVELTEELLANYDIAYINDVRSYDRDDDGELDDWDMEIIKIKKQTRLKANYPYVIRPKNEGAINLNITQFYETLYSTAPEYQKDVTCSSAFKQYAVKGVYTKTVSANLDKGNYVYAINKKGEWQKMGLETSLLPFRLYLTMANRDGSPIAPSEVAAQTIRMRLVGEESEDDTTLIYDLEADEESENDPTVIYDLQGRRVLEPKRGHLYIINGKKVIR